MKKSLLFIIFLFTIKVAFSCGCEDVFGLDESDLVFNGRVVSVDRVDTTFIDYAITFKVEKVVKGKLSKQKVIVHTPCLSVACCGIPFEKNENYIVFATVKSNYYYTDACTATNKTD
jgi:hypothetical protein